MVAFCKGIQLACPVGSYIRPKPGEHLEHAAGLLLIIPLAVCCRCCQKVRRLHACQYSLYEVVYCRS
jgi:hypothetical protein